MKKLLHFLKLAWSVSPFYLILLVLNALCEAAKTIINIVLPMFLIDELTSGQDISKVLLFGGLIVFNNVGMQLLANTFKRFMEVESVKTSEGMEKLMSEKIMNLEYSYLENPYYLDLKERAAFTIQNQGAIAGLINHGAQVLSNGATLIGLIGILLSLGPVLFIVLVIGIVICILIYAGVSKDQTNFMQELIPINRRFGYYFNLAFGKEVQKDIRLYGMSDMIGNRIVDFSNDTCDIFEKLMVRLQGAMGKMAAVGEGLAAFSYAYVGLRTLGTSLGPQISLGGLTMYVSAAINFSSMVIAFGESIISMFQFLSWLDPYMEFMTLTEETMETGKEAFEGAVESIEFRDVTFTYPGAEAPVLKSVSFSIQRGEKISIVGLNGAGKSTLVKLICRMYQADSGEILVNGKNIYDYDYLSYMNTISAVFQDYRLFNFSIAENISCQGEEGDEKELARLIKEVGLAEKIKELPLGMASRFGKDYDEDGIEMSGGQGQKIAIARALYKKASMVILDEPASALDPIAEAEIYEKFNSLVEEKTAIYISHRMSSSVFCDRILLLENGRVADFDTHENLMQKTDSLYYKLFQSQAENYRLEAYYGEAGDIGRFGEV